MSGIGVKLGVEGEQEFKSALKEINTNLKTLGTEMKAVTSEYDRSDKSVDNLTKQNQVLNKQIDEQKGKLDILKGKLAESAKEYGENDAQTQKWQQAVNLATADLNKMERQLDGNNKELDEAAKSGGKAGDEIEKAGVKAKGAGDDAEKSGGGWGKLKDGLVQVGEMAAKAIAALGAAAMAAGTALVGASVSGAAYADDIITLSDVTGIATDELQKFRYASELLDVSEETLHKSMAKNIKSMAAAREGASEASVIFEQLGLDIAELGYGSYSIEELKDIYKDLVETATEGEGEMRFAAQGALESLGITYMDLERKDADKLFDKFVTGTETAARKTNLMADSYKKLGIEVTNADGTLRDSQEVYWEIIDALGQVENETERDAIAMQLLGKSAQELNPIIKSGSEAMRQLGDEAEAAGYVLSEDTLDAFGAFDDQLQYLKRNSEAAKNALGTVLLPMLTELSTDGNALLKNFTKGLQDANGDIGAIGEVLGSTLSEIVNKIIEKLPEVIEAGMAIIGALGQGLMDNLPMLMESALEVVTMLAGEIITALPQILDAATEIIVTLVSGISQALPQLIPAAVGALMTMVQGLVDNLPLLLNAALELVIGLTQGILAAIPVLVDALPDIIIAIVTFLAESIPQIIDAGIELISSLVTELPKIIDTIVAAIPKIITSVLEAVKKSIPKIIDAGIKLLVALVQALPEIIITVVAAMPKIVSALVDGIIGEIDLIIMAGVQLFTALVQNLPTIIMEVLRAVPQIMSALVSAFSDSIGEMISVGDNLIKGLWQGINDAGAWLRDKISGFFGGVVDNIKNFFGISSPSKLFAGLGTNMAEGLGIGFGEEMKDVAKQMNTAIPTSFAVDAYGTGRLAGAQARGVNITINGLSVREDMDVERIAQRLYSLQNRAARAKGVYA